MLDPTAPRPFKLDARLEKLLQTAEPRVFALLAVDEQGFLVINTRVGMPVPYEFDGRYLKLDLGRAIEPAAGPQGSLQG